MQFQRSLMHNLLILLYQELNNVVIQKNGTVLNNVLPENRFYLNKGIPLVLKRQLVFYFLHYTMCIKSHWQSDN